MITFIRTVSLLLAVTLVFLTLGILASGALYGGSGLYTVLIDIRDTSLYSPVILLLIEVLSPAFPILMIFLIHSLVKFAGELKAGECGMVRRRWRIIVGLISTSLAITLLPGISTGYAYSWVGGDAFLVLVGFLYCYSSFVAVRGLCGSEFVAVRANY
jgi:hypothetical protein